MLVENGSNAIGVMSMQRMEDAYIVEENVNGNVFERFVRTSPYFETIKF